MRVSVSILGLFSYRYSRKGGTVRKPLCMKYNMSVVCKWILPTHIAQVPIDNGDRATCIWRLNCQGIVSKVTKQQCCSILSINSNFITFWCFRHKTVVTITKGLMLLSLKLKCGEKDMETRLKYNCAHLRSTRESLTFEYDIWWYWVSRRQYWLVLGGAWSV